MNYHPEASQYKELVDKMNFHESKRLSDEDDQRVALVDIDETICFYGEKRQYDLAEPNQEYIAKINKMYDEGWKIVYWTARGGSAKSVAEGRCYYDFTWKQLESWGCKFHELCTGTKGKYIKPPYDLVIDDKAKRIEEI
tara:strand:+ start:311 stop:727 length:417 start_codon:yes stop_codon:yes gene_type:complete